MWLLLTCQIPLCLWSPATLSLAGKRRAKDTPRSPRCGRPRHRRASAAGSCRARRVVQRRPSEGGQKRQQIRWRKNQAESLDVVTPELHPERMRVVGQRLEAARESIGIGLPVAETLLEV